MGFRNGSNGKVKYLCFIFSMVVFTAGAQERVFMATLMEFRENGCDQKVYGNYFDRNVFLAAKEFSPECAYNYFKVMNLSAEVMVEILRGYIFMEEKSQNLVLKKILTDMNDSFHSEELFYIYQNICLIYEHEELSVLRKLLPEDSKEARCVFGKQ